MTDELKPCPFCGGKAIAFPDSDDSIDYSLQHYSKGCPIGDYWDWYPTAEQAITAWNTRADSRVVALGLRAALDLVAGLPTPDSEMIMNGHEDAYRAIEAALAAIERENTDETK